MKVLPSIVVVGAGALLLLGYGVAVGFRSEPVVSRPLPSPSASASQDAYTSARQLGWEAAVLVQHPPHPTPIWQQARVKWRQAIRLLESIPANSPRATAARSLLTIYRTNYATISDRLDREQTAVDQLAAAQKKAWQAATMVQDAPHSLRLWQRAHQKWHQAIAALNAAPIQTTPTGTIRQKLQTYRQNQADIQHRIATETQALGVLQQFAQTGRQLGTLADRALAGEPVESVGLDEKDYAQRVVLLEKALAQLGSTPRKNGKTPTVQHPLYADLASILEDYQTARRLWQSYTATHANYLGWLKAGGMMPELVSISQAEGQLLHQKYQIKTRSNGTKVSLRFTVWDIWRQADDRIAKLEQQVQAQE